MVDDVTCGITTEFFTIHIFEDIADGVPELIRQG